jgi:integrase
MIAQEICFKRFDPCFFYVFSSFLRKSPRQISRTYGVTLERHHFGGQVMITPTAVSLSELLEQLILQHENGLANSTVQCFFKPALSDFSRFLGHEASLSDLTRDNVNRWLIHKTESGCAPSTIKTRRNAILGLWRYAYESELLEDEPKRIRKVRLTYLGVDAWTPEEITRLVATAIEGKDSYLGTTGLVHSLFFGSLISAGYDTALRLGDLLALRRDMIQVKNRCGYIRVVESKTGKVKSARLYPHTMSLIDQLWDLKPDREKIWPLWCRREQFYRSFNTLVKRAGIRKGTFRWLRRASITQVELIQPGWGTIHAGHSDPIITKRHYTDGKQLNEEVTAPPPLFTGKVKAK